MLQSKEHTSTFSSIVFILTHIWIFQGMWRCFKTYEKQILHNYYCQILTHEVCDSIIYMSLNANGLFDIWFQWDLKFWCKISSPPKTHAKMGGTSFGYLLFIYVIFLTSQTHNMLAIYAKLKLIWRLFKMLFQTKGRWVNYETFERLFRG